MKIKKFIRKYCEKDWRNFLMWTATLCISAALFLRIFLHETVDMTFAWFGSAILVVITAHLMDGGVIECKNNVMP